MRLRTRLTLAVTLVALAAVAVTALLAVEVAERRVGRLLETPVPVSSPAAPTTRDRTGAATVPPARAGAPSDGHGTGSARSGPGPVAAGTRHALLVRDLWRANGEAAAIALILAAAAGAFLAIRLTRPLKRLTEVAQRYAAGERTARADERGRDEVAEVATAFNQLADRLSSEEAQQQRLIADIAHELRTPLTVLKGELEALEDGLLDGSPTTFHRLGDEVTLLTRLVQDLRLLTRAESGELAMRRVPVDLRALAGEVSASFGAHAAERGVRVVTELAEASVDGDPDRLRQVLVNLLDNAHRFAPAGTTIEVSLRRDGRRAILSVRDHGPGIPEADRERVFQRFYRADEARSRATGGSGLGLSIVRSLVSLHGGNVTAAGHPQGGAVLSVSLPLTSAGAPTEPPG